MVNTCTSTLLQGYNVTCMWACCRASALGARRIISLEARAAPLTQAQLAPTPLSKHIRPTAVKSSSDNSANGSRGETSSDDSSEVPETPTAGGPADVMQSADDDLDPDTIRAKSHEEVSAAAEAKEKAFLRKESVTVQVHAACTAACICVTIAAAGSMQV